jgi:hypothetical protein
MAIAPHHPTDDGDACSPTLTEAPPPWQETPTVPRRPGLTQSTQLDRGSPSPENPPDSPIDIDLASVPASRFDFKSTLTATFCTQNNEAINHDIINRIFFEISIVFCILTVYNLNKRPSTTNGTRQQ